MLIHGGTGQMVGQLYLSKVAWTYARLMTTIQEKSIRAVEVKSGVTIDLTAVFGAPQIVMITSS